MSDALNSLLDSSIDDLADLPAFQVYPAGCHRVTVSWEQKVVADHPSVELKLKAIETIELANPTKDTPLEPGTEGTVLFMLDNEFGQGALKEVIKPFAAATGAANLRAAMEASKGMECEVVTKVTFNKDKTQSYMKVVKVTL